MNFPFKVVASFFRRKTLPIYFENETEARTKKKQQPNGEGERDLIESVAYSLPKCVYTPHSLVWQQRIFAGKLTEHHAHHSQSHPIKLIKRKTMNCKTHFIGNSENGWSIAIFPCILISISLFCSFIQEKFIQNTSRHWQSSQMSHFVHTQSIF